MSRNAEALLADETSIAHLYRRLLAARKASPALQLGWYDPIEVPGDVIAWRRTADPSGTRGPGDRIVALNMGSDPAPVDVRGTVVVASDGAGEGQPFGGTLAGDHAVLLDPSA